MAVYIVQRPGRLGRLGFLQELESDIVSLGTTAGQTAGSAAGGLIQGVVQPIATPVLIGLALVAIIVVGPALLRHD